MSSFLPLSDKELEYLLYGQCNVYTFKEDRRRRRDFERDEEIDNRGEPNAKKTKAKPKPKPEAPKPKPESLRATGLDYHIQENCKAHRTDRYECTDEDNDDPELVCRRGQSIHLTIKLNKAYNKREDELTIVMEIGIFPRANFGTKAVIRLDAEDKKFEPTEWGANLMGQKDKCLDINLHVPCDCVIGEWRIAIVTKSKKNETETPIRWEPRDDITVLFNPYCEADSVYMPKSDDDDSWRNEYVMNESGSVWRGRAGPYVTSQNLGIMFKEGILDASLTILRRAFRNRKAGRDNVNKMKDPVQVTRMISKVLNCNDDDGVLVGNWSGKYGEYTSPGAWNSSVAILREYMETGKPVRYGQCWVFACVTTTVCRALGIPARPVTNFDSAHDTDCSNTADSYYYEDVNGGFTRVEGDSTWNFHVWNEVWMKRPDLLDKYENYNGWQVIDATPQEESEGFAQCGPASLKAVKKGRVNLPYDTGFVFSEVNADKVTWAIEYDGTETRLKLETDSVGHQISTKQPGKFLWKRLDLTDSYKFDEGSLEEREAVRRAVRLGSKASWPTYQDGLPSDDVVFKLEHDEDLMIGKDVHVKLTGKNHGRIARQLDNVAIKTAVVTYDDREVCEVKRNATKHKTIGPGEEFEINVVLTEEQYLPNVAEHGFLTFTACAFVRKAQDGRNERPKGTFFQKDTFAFQKPSLEVELPSTATVGSDVEVVLKYTNPLKRALTVRQIAYSSAGFDDAQIRSAVESIPGNCAYTENFYIKARRKGNFFVLVSLITEELPDIGGSAEINVTAKK